MRSDVRFILYGRAALVLGFENVPEAFASTIDVDAILPLVEMPDIEKNDQFWNALEAANRELEPSGLYITHLFGDDQVILSPDWLSHIRPIELACKHLKLFRPGTPDFILTKMMRVDPQDRSDIQFLLEQPDVDTAELEKMLPKAQVPDVAEIREAYETNCRWLKGIIRG